MLAETLTVGSGQWAGLHPRLHQRDRRCLGFQDWSSYEGICLWLYGNNTGGVILMEFAENRNPGSTTDDAERWSTKSLTTLRAGRFFTIPFAEFNRKEIGNGAPNDGLTLEEVHGYSIGGFRLRGHGHEHLLRR